MRPSRNSIIFATARNYRTLIYYLDNFEDEIVRNDAIHDSDIDIDIFTPLMTEKEFIDYTLNKSPRADSIAQLIISRESNTKVKIKLDLIKRYIANVLVFGDKPAARNLLKKLLKLINWHKRILSDTLTMSEILWLSIGYEKIIIDTAKILGYPITLAYLTDSATSEGIIESYKLEVRLLPTLKYVKTNIKTVLKEVWEERIFPFIDNWNKWELESIRILTMMEMDKPELTAAISRITMSKIGYNDLDLENYIDELLGINIL